MEDAFINQSTDNNSDNTSKDVQNSHVYQVRSRKAKRGFDLISDVLPFGALWYAGVNAVANAIGYAEHCSRSHNAVIRVYDEAGNVIEKHEHKCEFKEW